MSSFSPVPQALTAIYFGKIQQKQTQFQYRWYAWYVQFNWSICNNIWWYSTICIYWQVKSVYFNISLSDTKLHIYHSREQQQGSVQYCNHTSPMIQKNLKYSFIHLISLIWQNRAWPFILTSSWMPITQCALSS